MLDTAAVKSKLSTTHPAMKALLAISAVLAYVMMPPLFRGLCFLAWAVYFLRKRMSWQRVVVVLLVNAGLLTFGHLTRGPRRGDHLTVNNRFIRVFSFREDVEDLALKHRAGADEHLIFDSIRTDRDLLLLNGSKFLVLEVSGDVAKVALEPPGRFSETDGGRRGRSGTRSTRCTSSSLTSTWHGDPWPGRPIARGGDRPPWPWGFGGPDVDAPVRFDRRRVASYGSTQR